MLKNVEVRAVRPQVNFARPASTSKLYHKNNFLRNMFFGSIDGGGSKKRPPGVGVKRRGDKSNCLLTSNVTQSFVNRYVSAGREILKGKVCQGMGRKLEKFGIICVDYGVWGARESVTELGGSGAGGSRSGRFLENRLGIRYT